MRDLLVVVGVIFAIGVSGLAQDSGDAGRAAIRKVIEDQQAAWNRHDLDRFMTGYWYSPELTFFSGGHEFKGWQTALDRYKKNYQSAGHEMGQLEFVICGLRCLVPMRPLFAENFI